MQRTSRGCPRVMFTATAGLVSAELAPSTPVMMKYLGLRLFNPTSPPQVPAYQGRVCQLGSISSHAQMASTSFLGLLFFVCLVSAGSLGVGLGLLFCVFFLFFSAC